MPTTLPQPDARSDPRTIDPRLDLDTEILRLRKDRDAVILAHYYQDDAIQDIADFVGDSLELSRQAAKTSAAVIAFCGVHFMAETAKILNPQKTVLLPDLDAGCSLADRCPADAFRAWQAAHPGHVTISYINCSAAIKAASDIICTSSNAVHIVKQIPTNQPILFTPDRHLGRWVIKQTGRDMVLWPGFCIVHEQFSLRRIVQMKERHPTALVIAHPECEEAVLDKADFIGSTSALLRFVRESKSKSFIVGTEAGILHQMQKARPDAELIPAEPNSGCNCALCPYMRLNTMEKLYLTLRDNRPQIELDPAVATAARRSVERMLEMSATIPAATTKPMD